MSVSTSSRVCAIAESQAYTGCQAHTQPSPRAKRQVPAASPLPRSAPFPATQTAPRTQSRLRFSFHNAPTATPRSSHWVSRINCCTHPPPKKRFCHPDTPRTDANPAHRVTLAQPSPSHGPSQPPGPRPAEDAPVDGRAPQIRRPAGQPTLRLCQWRSLWSVAPFRAAGLLAPSQLAMELYADSEP